MTIDFTPRAWAEYTALQRDRQQLKRVNALLADIRRTPFGGIGKPEPLKHQLTGYWSRRIDQDNRLIYRIYTDATDVEHCEVLQCAGHYT